MKETVIFYGTPAYGHVNASLYFVQELCKKYHVVYYCSALFKKQIEETGAAFKPYPINQDDIDHTDKNFEFGNKPFYSYRICLQINLLILDVLLFEARQIMPNFIIYDSIASWGKNVAYILKKPSVAFHTFITLDRMFSKSGWTYFFAFLPKIIKQLYLFPTIIPLKIELKKKYGIKNINFISTTLNKGALNIMSFSPSLQPGGEKFNSSYFFLGSSTLKRQNPNTFNDIDCEDLSNLVYISLGTMVSDISFIKRIFEELGNTKYTVLLSVGIANVSNNDIPKNFIIRKMINQLEILKHAKVFVSTGGMNGVLEAISAGVPHIIFPTQGEKKINAKTVAKLGLGEAIKNFRHLRQKIDFWATKRIDKTLIDEISAVHTNDCLDVIDQFVNK